VKVAGTLALQEVLEPSHRHVKGVDGVVTETRRCFDYVGIVLHQSPLFALSFAQKRNRYRTSAVFTNLQSRFYRAMSVHLSVTLVDHDHI